MTLSDFMRRVRTAFGPQMEHATPANVREFLDEIAHERWQQEKAERATETGFGIPSVVVIPDDAVTSYEDILRCFFVDALAAADEQALIQLWTFALDIAYAGLEDQTAQKICGLFDEADRGESGEGPDLS